MNDKPRILVVDLSSTIGASSSDALGAPMFLKVAHSSLQTFYEFFTPLLYAEA